MNAPSKVKADTIAAAYVAAFAEIEAATKDAKGQVGQQKYKYADLSSVIAAIKPALINNGLAFTQPCEPTGEGVTVRTMLHHVSGEALDLGSLFVPANKRDAQGFGSALTYARRYALVSAFGVPTEDDDGNAAVASMSRQEPKQEVSPSSAMPDDEYSRLVAKMKTAGVAATKLHETFGVTDLRALSQDQYAAAMKRLDKTIADKAKAQTNEQAKDFGKELLDDEIPY